MIAWEPPAAGALPGAAEAAEAIMAPVDGHLRQRPGDWVGAQAILLTAILGSPVAPDGSAFTAVRANAEPMIRDDPWITVRPFGPELAAAPVTIAVGTAPNEVVAAAGALGELTGAPATVVDTPQHEIYLQDPAVLARLVGSPPR